MIFYSLDYRCQSMHQTLLCTKRRAKNKLFFIILNNMIILILDIKVVENVDLNKVALGLVLVVILPKTTNWVCYTNMNSIYNTHHIVHATQTFKIHHDNLHLIVYKPHNEFLKDVISSHHHFMNHKTYNRIPNGKQLTTW